MKLFHIELMEGEEMALLILLLIYLLNNVMMQTMLMEMADPPLVKMNLLLHVKSNPKFKYLNEEQNLEEMVNSTKMLVKFEMIKT